MEISILSLALEIYFLVPCRSPYKYIHFTPDDSYKPISSWHFSGLHGLHIIFGLGVGTGPMFAQSNGREGLKFDGGVRYSSFPSGFDQENSLLATDCYCQLPHDNEGSQLYNDAEDRRPERDRAVGSLKMILSNWLPSYMFGACSVTELLLYWIFINILIA